MGGGGFINFVRTTIICQCLLTNEYFKIFFLVDWSGLEFLHNLGSTKLSSVKEINLNFENNF